MKMKVFMNASRCGFGSGLVLVAAESVKQAIYTMFLDVEPKSDFIFYDSNDNRTDDIEKAKNIEHTVFDMSDWVEMKELSYNGNSPKVLCCEYYLES